MRIVCQHEKFIDIKDWNGLHKMSNNFLHFFQILS